MLGSSQVYNPNPKKKPELQNCSVPDLIPIYFLRGVTIQMNFRIRSVFRDLGTDLAINTTRKQTKHENT